MTNPTINVNLSSLDEGTVPIVTGSIEVAEGGQIDISVTWPSSASNSINCDLDFSQSGNQDPFNDIDGSHTSNSMTRESSTDSAVLTLDVQKDAVVTTDTYDLTLTIDGQTYTKDPIIVVTKIPPK